MQDFVLGPCLVFYGDPWVAAGAGMTWLGQTNGDVTVNPGLRSTTVKTDQLGNAATHDGAYSLGVNPIARVPLVDNDIDKLLALLPDGEKVTGTNTVLNFGSGVKTIVPKSLCLLPFFERASAIAAKHAVWFPSALVVNFGELVFRSPQGDNAASVHTVEFQSLYREADGDTPANAIPEKARFMMMGDPNENMGLGQWSLPATAGPFSLS